LKKIEVLIHCLTNFPSHDFHDLIKCYVFLLFCHRGTPSWETESVGRVRRSAQPYRLFRLPWGHLQGKALAFIDRTGMIGQGEPATELATQLPGTGCLTEGMGRDDQAKNPAGSSLSGTARDASGSSQRFTKTQLAQRCDGLSLLLCHVRPPPPALGSDRDQLWAEAAAAEVSGEPLTIPEDLWGDAAVEQKARMNQDAWEDLLSTRLASLHNNKKEMGGKFALSS
jgi:hypothetical protein